MNLKNKVNKILSEIVAEIEHGECLYDEEMFAEFDDKVNEFREACRSCFEQNSKEEWII